MRTICRALLAICSVLLAAGAALHARAFPAASAAAGHANLRLNYVNDFRVLWLGDSATLLIVAVLFAIIAIRPAAASPEVAIVVAAIPAATAVLIYIFVGNFYAGHLLIGTSIIAAIANFRLRPNAAPPERVHSIVG